MAGDRNVRDYVLKGKRGFLVLLGIPVDSGVYFKGKLLLKRVISGTVECLGYEISQDDPENGDLEIFSPKGYSLLRLQSVSREAADDATSRKIDREYLKRFNLDEDQVADQISALNIRANPQEMSWVVLQRLDAPWTKVLDDYLPRCGHGTKSNLFERDRSSSFPGDQGFISDSAERSLNVNFYESEESLAAVGQRIRLYKPNPEWQSSVESVRHCLRSRRQPRVVVAGGKGVGKSTFVRYLTNRLLKNHGSVLVIDLDPGQAEFTVPGCISCVVIRHPLLGPNFCHLDLEKSCCVNLGEVNVSNIAGRYERSVRRLIRFCEGSKNMKDLPWIVNTMGFSRGLGVRFMRQVLSNIRPSTLVEIKSRFDKKNFECNLEEHRQTEAFNLLSYEAMPESLEARDMGAKDLWGIPEPSRLRDICILSHFGRLYDHNANLSGAAPFKIAWKSVLVQNLRQETVRPRDVPRVLNMSLVSLGRTRHSERPSSDVGWPRLIPSDAEVDAVGFGFVRGVNVEKKVFYVVTTLTRKEISVVNCVSFGAVILPRGVIASQPSTFPKTPGQAVPGVPFREETPASALNPLATPWQRYSRPKGFGQQGQ